MCGEGMVRVCGEGTGGVETRWGRSGEDETRLSSPHHHAGPRYPTPPTSLSPPHPKLVPAEAGPESEESAHEKSAADPEAKRDKQDLKRDLKPEAKRTKAASAGSAAGSTGGKASSKTLVRGGWVRMGLSRGGWVGASRTTRHTSVSAPDSSLSAADFSVSAADFSVSGVPDLLSPPCQPLPHTRRGPGRVKVATPPEAWPAFILQPRRAFPPCTQLWWLRRGCLSLGIAG